MGGALFDSPEGQICLCLPMEVNDTFKKGRVGTVIVTSLAALFNRYFGYKVRRYLKGICPKNTRACLQPYRRNLIFLEHTSWYISSYAIFTLVQNAILVLSASFGQYPTVLFWVHNAAYFAFVDILQGLVLPLQMTVPPADKRPEGRSQFYVHKPELLEPRVEWEKDTLYLKAVANSSQSPQKFCYVSKTKNLPFLTRLASPVRFSKRENGASVFDRRSTQHGREDGATVFYKDSTEARRKDGNCTKRNEDRRMEDGSLRMRSEDGWMEDESQEVRTVELLADHDQRTTTGSHIRMVNEASVWNRTSAY